MNGSTYLVPRQVTSRFEFLPGWGIPESIGLLAGLGGGFLGYQLTVGMGLPDQIRVIGTALPTAAGIAIPRAGDQIARFLMFATGQRRFLFRTGTGRQAQPKTTLPARGLKSPLFMAILSVLGLAKPARGTGRSPAQQTAQDWLPVLDIRDGLIQRKDGQWVIALRVSPLNLGLRSPNEQTRIIGAVHEAINALQHPAQILSLPRPLDLDGYVRGLEARMHEVDAKRQQLLRPYIRYVAGLVSGGEAQERRYYVLAPQPPGKAGPEEVRHRAADLAARLRQADLQVDVLEDGELLALLHVWSHPAQAAFERPPAGPPNVTTLLEVSDSGDPQAKA